MASERLHLKSGHPAGAEPTRRTDLGELLERIADADGAAFEELYRRSAPALFAICFRILTDRDQAADALQDTFLAIWRRAGSFDKGRGKPMTWLATVGRNSSIDRLRACRASSPVPLSEANDIEDDRPNAADQIERRDQARQLIDCLGKMEASERSLISRAFFDDVSYPDIASRASMPLSTVKSQIRRGLSKMRRHLDVAEREGFEPSRSC